MQTILAVLSAIAATTVFGFAHYRYIRRGLPKTWQWKLLLFVVGAVTYLSTGVLLLVVVGNTSAATTVNAGDDMLAAAITAILGGIASVRLVPRGLKATLDMAEKNAQRRQANNSGESTNL